MKVVIIEDEHYAAEALEKMLRKIKSNLIVFGKIASVEEGRACFSTQPIPDLVFSDIQLSDGLVFEIFEDHPLHCPVVLRPLSISMP